MQPKQPLSGLIKKIIIYLFLGVLAILCFIPFYIMVMNSTYSDPEIAKSVHFLPGDALMENYEILITDVDMLKAFLNSLLITVPFVVVSGFFGALTAYGFAKYRFKGNSVLFYIILGTLMIPLQLTVIGYYYLSVMIKTANTHFAIWLPAFCNASTVFFIRQYIESSVPDSLIEAARIDGAREFHIFLRIIFPLILPAVATLSIFNFVASWNNFMTPLVLLHNENLYPLPLVIASIRDIFVFNYGAIYLAISISILPIMIAFFTFSRYIIGGLTIGSVKE